MNRVVVGLVLAAGESSRMGRPKQLLDWHGHPLVAAQTEALLSGGCRLVVVVLGAHRFLVQPAVPSQANVQIVNNHAWRSGRASSIRAGARAVPSREDAVVVSSVDQPTSDVVVGKLILALAEMPSAAMVVPRYDGRNGHPPILRGGLVAELREVSERGEGLRRLRRRYVEQTAFLDLDDPIITQNLNTPTAYQEALAMSHEVHRDSTGGKRERRPPAESKALA